MDITDKSPEPRKKLKGIYEDDASFASKTIIKNKEDSSMSSISRKRHYDGKSIAALPQNIVFASSAKKCI